MADIKRRITSAERRIRAADAKDAKRAHCRGCTENFYNGNNSLGVKECWHFKDAKLVSKKMVHLAQVPPWNQQPIKVLSCYRAKGYAFIAPDRSN